MLSAHFGTSAHYFPAYPQEAEIRAIEHAYGVTLPEDFRAYLLQAAPSNELWSDGDILWWPPARITNIPDEYEHPVTDPFVATNAGSYLFFADFMLWAWAWAICCDDGEDRGKIALIDGSSDRIVARSFTEFVEAAMRDSMSVS